MKMLGGDDDKQVKKMGERARHTKKENMGKYDNEGE